MPKSVQIYYRKGNWEVKKGMGNWHPKYTATMPEDQVKKNLKLEYPFHKINRFKKTEGNGGK